MLELQRTNCSTKRCWYQPNINKIRSNNRIRCFETRNGNNYDKKIREELFQLSKEFLVDDPTSEKASNNMEDDAKENDVCEKKICDALTASIASQ